MRRATTILYVAAMIMAMLACRRTAGADTIAAGAEVVVATFDDLPATPVGYLGTYHGFSWLGWHWFDHRSATPGSGYETGCISLNNAIYREATAGGPFITRATQFEAFILHGACLTAGWKIGMTVEVTGYFANEAKYVDSVTVSYDSPSNVSFPSIPIDALGFRAYGGTVAPEFASHFEEWENPNHLVLDNIAYSVPIPEPTTLALLAMGGLAMLRRRPFG